MSVSMTRERRANRLLIELNELRDAQHHAAPGALDQQALQLILDAFEEITAAERDAALATLTDAPQ